jgi:glyoxylase-like metal-dependent hydrolase (beta-lactamase superfamily II)
VITYTAGESGLYVNSYLVETPAGVVAIDAGLLVSDARAFRARLDATGKPLLAVFVTHGHPDHFNGVVEIVRGRADVPIYATPQGKRVIEEVADAKRAQWGPTYGDEWPAETAYPNSVVADGETVELDGLSIRVHELGPCESPSEAVFVVEAAGQAPVAFTGDLFYNGLHAYNADGLSGPWLGALDRARPLVARTAELYPGHGRPCGLDALDDQRRYELFLRAAVRELAAGDVELSDTAKEELTARLCRFAGHERLSWLVGLSADAVAAELAGGPDGRSG